MKIIRMDYKQCELSKAVYIEGDSVTFDLENHPTKFMLFKDHKKKFTTKHQLTLEFPNNDARNMFLYQLESRDTLKDAIKTLSALGDHFHHNPANKMLVDFLKDFIVSKNGTYQTIDQELAPAPAPAPAPAMA